MFGNIYAADPANWPYIAIILGFLLLIAFPIHEFFHAFMAYRLGDGTAKMFGKLTLNPLAHFHPVGGWMLIISTLLFGLPLICIAVLLLFNLPQPWAIAIAALSFCSAAAGVFIERWLFFAEAVHVVTVFYRGGAA